VISGLPRDMGFNIKKYMQQIFANKYQKVTMKISFIGLGIMGKPMALNLLKAGYALNVFARRADMMDSLIQARH